MTRNCIAKWPVNAAWRWQSLKQVPLVSRQFIKQADIAGLLASGAFGCHWQGCQKIKPLFLGDGRNPANQILRTDVGLLDGRNCGRVWELFTHHRPLPAPINQVGSGDCRLGIIGG